MCVCMHMRVFCVCTVTLMFTLRVCVVYVVCPHACTHIAYIVGSIYVHACSVYQCCTHEVLL